ncbi:LOW QUALITY PROTEIN: serine protease 53 [Varanus komodoensis]|uniref:LOW QUALITY PROTEIN: serine protease 53 n=1 Tax=Varanus komodoensis TaxID=61221 RepID=UPI001CF77248|nr:LOW QUALITY PROTEIN: serine protease 53 [Varanus komodoensis]
MTNLHIQKNAMLSKTDEEWQGGMVEVASPCHGASMHIKIQSCTEQAERRRRSSRMSSLTRGFHSFGLLWMLVLMGLTCGRQKPILVLRVAGGKNVRRGEWPWQVSLQYKGRHICSGTLIDERWILTAAHCFFKDRKRICPEDCQVVLGQVKLTAEMRTGVDRKISKVILHEGYKEGSVQSDIALAHLDKPVSYSGDISPICLPYSDHQFAFGTQCWLSGWGNIASDVSLPDPMILQEMTVELLTADTCNCIYSNLRIRQIVNPALPKTVCALSPNHRAGPCQGDSGGPVVCLEKGQWFQAGIMSAALNCGRFVGPTILTETRSYASWIQNHVEGASFANQIKPVVNTSDKYLCTGCGVMKEDSAGRGAEGPWPWYVSLRHRGKHVCGGTLVAEDWILTAAQCFIGRQETEGWEVLLGETLEGGQQKWQEKRALQSNTLHAAYINMTEGFDIAMAKLAQPVVFGDSIRTICAPYSTHQFPFGSTCWTRGRRTDGDKPSGSLGGVEVKLISSKNCNCIYDKNSNPGSKVPITDSMMCARPHKSSMRCEESAGEPLVCNHEGMWFLAGISSFGKGCGTLVHPGVYTSVHAYQEWVMKTGSTTYFGVQKTPLPVVHEEDSCTNASLPEVGQLEYDA